MKPYATWLVLAGVVIAVGLGAWGVNARMQEGREDKAVAALALVTPKADLKAPDLAAAKALEKFSSAGDGAVAAIAPTAILRKAYGCARLQAGK